MSKRPAEAPCPHDLPDCLVCALGATERAIGGAISSLAVVEGSDPLRWRALGPDDRTGEGSTPVAALRSLAERAA